MKYIISLYFLILCTSLLAQPQVLTVYEKQGLLAQYPFEERPKISFKDGNLIVKSMDVEVSYPLVQIDKYTLNEGEKDFSSHNVTINDDACLSYENSSDIMHCNITYIRTFSDTSWQSFYVPFEVNCAMFDDVEFALINNFHQYDDNNDGIFDRTVLEIHKAGIGDVLLPNYPYLVRAKEIGEKKIVVNDAVLYATEQFTIDCSSVEVKYKFKGNYETLNDMRSKGCYYLNNGYLEKPNTMSQTLPPFRWFMTMETRGSQTKENPIVVNSPKIRVALVSEDATGIVNSTLNSEHSESIIYDLQGVKRQQPLRSGIYIIKTKNGASHKVFVR